MSSTNTNNNTALASDWALAKDEQKAVSLIVHMRRSSLALPWFRFVYAQGDDSKLQLIFATHLVSIDGEGLGALLEAAANQRVISITEPTQSEAKFSVRGLNAGEVRGAAIHSITVEKFK
jgi:hypothetical protein